MDETKEKKFRPITEQERLSQDMELTGEIWTVCEVIREIYKIASGIKDDPRAEAIKEKARTAVAMTKRMNRKLREYKKDYDEGWWESKR